MGKERLQAREGQAQFLRDFFSNQILLHTQVVTRSWSSRVPTFHVLTPALPRLSL